MSSVLDEGEQREDQLMNMSTRVLVNLWQNDNMAAELKRLALLFDEILYYPPHISVLSNELQTDRSRFKHVGKGFTYIDQFSFARDVFPGVFVSDESLKGDGLATTVINLHAAGVMRPITQDPKVQLLLPDELKNVMHSLWAREMEDETFLQLTRTSKEDFNKPIEMGGMTLREPDGNEFSTVWVNPPEAFNVSSILTMQAYYAAEMDATPVLFPTQLQKAWTHRMNKCLQLVQHLGRQELCSPVYPSIEVALGAAGFWLSGLLFGNDLVEHLSINDVLKLRKALDEPRRDFISTHLTVLAGMIQDNPWSDNSLEKVKTYVQTQLKPAIQRFNQEGKALWESTLGKLSVRFTEMIAGVSAGGGAGGLASSVLVGSSFWTLFGLGAAAGATRVAPKLVSDLVELALESRKRQRNGLFYVTNAQQRQAGSQ